jgi:hypothetical protein
LPLLSSLIQAGILPEWATLTRMDLGHQSFPQPIHDSWPIDTLLHQPNRLACGGARLSGICTPESIA